MINLLLEATPIDVATGATVTVHMSSRHASARGVYLDDKEWLPAITGWSGRTLSLTSNGQTQQSQVSPGNLTFDIQAALDNLAWTSLSWDGAAITIWRGQDGDDFSAYDLVFSGVGGAVSCDGVAATLPLLGAEALLNAAQLLSASYGGTGGADGNIGLMGTLKPWASGVCNFIDPLLIDSAYQVYQYHGYGPTGGVVDVLEFGESINPDGSFATVASYADLIALNMPDGSWASAPSVGMFRLANQPSKKLSAIVWGALDHDGSFPQTIDKIAQHLLRQAGIPDSLIDLDSLQQFSSYQWCDVITDAANVGDVLRQMLFEANGYLLPDSSGRWAAGRFFGDNLQGELRSDRTSGPPVKSWKQLTTAAPTYSVRIGADRCWNVHSETDISPALEQLSDQQLANEQAAAAALLAAQDAQAAADVEKQRVDEIVADNILDRSEKVDQNRRFAEESQAHAALMAANSQFDVSAERSNYDACWNSLTTYLNGLSPAFTDLTQSTPIVATDYANAWKNYELAKVTLYNAMSGYASTTATWGGVSGTGRPADYATNTGDPGAPFGNSGQTVGSVIGDVAAATSAAGVYAAPPSIPTGLGIASDLNASGAADAQIGWQADADANFSYYELQVAQNGGGYVTVFTGTSTQYFLRGLPPATQISAQLRAVDKWRNTSGWSAAVAATLIRDTTPPGALTSLSVNATLATLFLHWNNPADSDLDHIEIWESPTNDQATAYLLTTVDALPGLTGGYTRAGMGAGQTVFYWLRAVDTSGNYGPWAYIAGTAGAVDNADVTPGLILPKASISSLSDPGTEGQTSTFDGRLVRYTSGVWTYAVTDTTSLVGQILGGQIADSNVGIKKFGPGVSIPIFANTSNINDGSVVAIKVGDMAVNAADGHIYRSTDANNLATSWVDMSAAASAITGQLSSDQISSVVASKISGQLAAANIPGIDASKVVSGQFGANQIAAEAIDSTKLASSIAAPRIWYGSDPNDGTVAAVRLGDLIYSTYWSKLFENTAGVGDTTHWTPLITDASNISGQLSSDQISSVVASKISGQLAAANIPGLDASQIVSGQLSASQIANGAIDNSKIANGLAIPLIVSKSNMNDGTVVAPSGGALAYNILDAKMYRNVDGANLAGAWYPTVVDTNYLSAPITSDQITGLDAGKVAGVLASFNIPGIDASKIVSGQFSTNFLADASVQAAKIADGAVNLNKLTVGSGANLILGAEQTQPAARVIHVEWNPDNRPLRLDSTLAITGVNAWTLEDNSTYALYEAQGYVGGTGVTDIAYHSAIDFSGNTTSSIAISAGKVYEFSVYTQMHRCFAKLLVV